MDLFIKGRRALKSKNANLLKNALQELEEAGYSPEAAEILGEAFQVDHWPTRKRAAEILIGYGDRVIRHVAKLLESDHPDQVYWSSFVLGNLGQEATQPLVRLLQSEDRDRRIYAVRALSRRSGQDSIRALLGCMDDRSWMVRKRVADALLARCEEAQVAAALKHELESDNRNRIYWAVKILANAPSSNAMSVLKEFLRGSDADHRYVALADSTGGDFDAERIKSILGLLGDPSPVVRERAMECLVQHGKPIAKAVAKTAQSRDPEIRYWSYQALYRVDPEAAIELVREGLRNRDDDNIYTLMRAMSGMKDARCVEMLVRMFADPKWVLRRFASDQLAAMGPFAVPHLWNYIEGSDEDQRYWGIVSLVKIGSGGNEALGRVLDHPDKEIRGIALAALSDVPISNEVVRMLVPRLNDEVWPHRRIAAKRIAEHGTAALSQVLPLALEDSDHLKYWSTFLLEEMVGPVATHFTKWLRSRRGTDQQKVLQVLMKLRTDDVVKTIKLGPNAWDDYFSITFGRSPFEELRADLFLRSPWPQLPSADENGMRELLKLTKQFKASDLHIGPEMPPMYRINGENLPLKCAPLMVEQCEGLLLSMLTEERMDWLKEKRSVDFTYNHPGVGRFRANIYKERRGLAGAMRSIPEDVPSLGDVGLSDQIAAMINKRHGMIVVTGPTGSGKSTTMAALVDSLNATRSAHIISIEDPVEYIYKPRRCFISQRGIGEHAHSFASALRDALREDPDIVVVGELRDRETIELASYAADTGHLVFGTLHSPTAAGSVNRMVDVFEAGRQEHIRSQLAEKLEVVIAQELIPMANGQGRVAAREILVNTPAVANLIRHNQMEQIRTVLETSSADGMRTLDYDLAFLVRRGTITFEIARKYCRDKNNFTMERVYRQQENY